MKAISIRAEDIVVGQRHRALSSDAVKTLAASMKEIGLRQPITVRVVDDMQVDGRMVSAVPVLVAGHHRLEAAMNLGWSHIDCVEVDDDAISAEMWEIAENLHRIDLTKDQRDEHIRRYAELKEAQREVSRQNDAKPKSGPQGGRPAGVASEIARETGLSKRTVERVLAPPPAPTPIRLPIADTDAVTRQFNAIVAAWDRACPEARERFLETVDQPVFDRTRAAG